MNSDYLLPSVIPILPTPGTLRIGHIEPCSLVSGPGRRSVVWVTGCRRQCPGCIKPEFISFTAGHEISLDELLHRLLSVADVEGVTFSGGEPFEQARPLAALSRELRAAGRTVGAYTGYTIEDLLAESGDKTDLLHELDFLIDGEYRQERPGPFRWFGSDNQRFFDLRSREVIPSGEPVREVQITVEGDQVTLVGFPNRDFERELRQRLLQRGIHLGGNDP